jgi:copper oxidase (laccase) domain-containing protein
MSSKDDGNVADSFGEAADTRKQLVLSVGNPTVACMKTEAANRIIDLNKEAGPPTSQQWTQYITDVFVSRLSSPVNLAMMPADCIPLVAWSAEHDLLVLAHGARRNLNSNVISELFTYLNDTYQITPKDFTYYIGPCIKAASYTFAAVDSQQFDNALWDKYISYHQGKYHVDIVGFLLAQLAEAGVPENTISLSPIDTGSDPAYFSHSRSQRTGEVEGRNLFLVQPLRSL